MATPKTTIPQIAIASVLVFAAALLYNYSNAALSPDGRFVLRELCAEEVPTTRVSGNVELDDTRCVQSVVSPVPVSIWLQGEIRRLVIVAPLGGWFIAVVWNGFRAD